MAQRNGSFSNITEKFVDAVFERTATVVGLRRRDSGTFYFGASNIIVNRLVLER
jgi:hypothetical protein